MTPANDPATLQNHSDNGFVVNFKNSSYYSMPDEPKSDFITRATSCIADDYKIEVTIELQELESESDLELYLSQRDDFEEDED